MSDFDILQNAKGSPGETAKVLIHTYYSLFYDEAKSSENFRALMEFRNTANMLVGLEPMNEDILDLLQEEYQLSNLIFGICYYEYLKNGDENIFKSYRDDIFSIIMFLHNENCGDAEPDNFEVEDLQETMEYIKKYA